MLINEIINISTAIIASIGTSSVIIIGLSNWLGKVWASRILEQDKLRYSRELEETKAKYERELEKYKVELDRSKVKSLRYSEYQFKQYNELWGTLCKLKRLANDLWENSSWKNVESFALHLEKTFNAVDRHQLLIENSHLEQLQKMLNAFDKYRIGKISLKNLQELNKNKSNEVDHNVQELIQSNKKDKEKYIELLKKISSNFKKQIH